MLWMTPNSTLPCYHSSTTQLSMGHRQVYPSLNRFCRRPTIFSRKTSATFAHLSFSTPCGPSSAITALANLSPNLNRRWRYHSVSSPQILIKSTLQTSLPTWMQWPLRPSETFPRR